MDLFFQYTYGTEEDLFNCLQCSELLPIDNAGEGMRGGRKNTGVALLVLISAVCTEAGMCAILARRKTMTEKDFLDAVSKVIKG